MRLYEVGGCVRDSFLGRESKDIDYAVEAESLDAMRNELLAEGYEIFVETPQFLTIRARHPDKRDTFDFVLCRKDGEYVDGRRPETVAPGTIFDDLARRDFTMNAIAIAEDGEIIDPHGGVEDINNKVIRCVGDPIERFTEDGLRVARAIRFAIILGFGIEYDTLHAMNDERAVLALRSVAIERVREEMERAFRHDTVGTMGVLQHNLSPSVTEAIFRDGLRLSATLKG